MGLFYFGQKNIPSLHAVSGYLKGAEREIRFIFYLILFLLCFVAFFMWMLSLQLPCLLTSA